MGLLYKASIRCIDLLEGSYNGNYPPENVLDLVKPPTALLGKSPKPERGTSELTISSRWVGLV